MPNRTNGLTIITPSSVVGAGSGATATINSNGSVTFASCTAVSLNSVFSSTYDMYMLKMSGTNATGAAEIRVRMRTASTSTDNTTASSYVSQALSATGATVSGFRDVQSYGVFSYGYATRGFGFTCYIFTPFLAQPTAFRIVSATDDTSARIYDNAVTHNQSVSYDSITVYPASSTIDGLISVYGFNQ